jgi:hypothetical protein
MNRSVELTAIDLGKEAAWLNDLRRAAQPAEFRNVEFVEDDLERPIQSSDENDEGEESTGVTVPAGVDQSSPPPGVFYPIQVFENDIREYYTRRQEGRVGTRIVYRSGAARPVRETYEQVKTLFAALPGVATE